MPRPSTLVLTQVRNLSDTVLVIGGGIAGIQASLDLAAGGAKVVIAERGPSIGGKMSGLDKNFPTLDCSICIESPKMNEVLHNPNITVMTLSQVVEVKGREGEFAVRIVENPRYVTDECTRCDLCVQECPQIRKNEFDMGIGARKAIYTPFSQAEPGKYVIDINSCLNEPPNYLPCQRCVKVCGPEAIDFNMVPRKHELKVGSIIVASGFDLLNPELLRDFGYGTDPDILTSYEFERLLSAAGPSEGEIIRPSNHTVPDSVLFVLCAGSRDQRLVKYCSRTCCMYSVKEAVQARDHGISEVTVLYMDIRAYGKGFDSFYNRSIKDGVRYVRGRPADIKRSGDRLSVRFESTEAGELIREHYDMVVLATASIPSSGTGDLARTLGIELDADGFFRTLSHNPVLSTRPGILIAGSASGPKDIPDSVTEGSAAAAMALGYIDQRVWVQEPVPPPLDVSGEPRIGVFLCDCGSNIAGVVDVKSVTERLKTVPNVVYAEENRYSCSGNTQGDIANRIKEKNLNRVVVSACSPKTHGATFQRICSRAGLNQYLFEMANVRNMNSWVHKNEKEKATEKAFEMVKMAIAKARFLTPLKDIEFPVTRRAIVVGGGVAGLSAASSLAGMGIETHLIEKSEELGGMMNRLDDLAPAGVKAREISTKKVEEFNESGAVAHLSTSVSGISGFVGNFQVSLSDGSSIGAGAIVVATGADPYMPHEFGYGENHRVLTSLDLEGKTENIDADKITIVSCVGSRNSERGCSRFCCSTMLNQAIKLREAGKKVRVLYKDIRSYSRYAEDLYYKASKAGVQFFRYDDTRRPEESIGFDNGMVTVGDELSDDVLGIPTDLMILNIGMTPGENKIASELKLSKDEENFLLELHPKLAPVEAAVSGVFMAGTVLGPKDFRESMLQGLAAASKAAGILMKDRILKEPIVASINQDRCTKCMQCASVCPYGAIKGERGKWIELNPAMCMGCGDCAAACFTDAINIPGFSDEELEAQIDAATETEPSRKIVVFACNWCSYAGADQAGISKMQYPTGARVIRTMCSSRVSQKLVWRAFERGAGAVLVTGCHINDCHYINANLDTEKRVERWRKTLEARGVSPDRLQLWWVSAAEGNRFARKITEMSGLIDKLQADEIEKSRSGFARRRVQ